MDSENTWPRPILAPAGSAAAPKGSAGCDENGSLEAAGNEEAAGGGNGSAGALWSDGKALHAEVDQRPVNPQKRRCPTAKVVFGPTSCKIIQAVPQKSIDGLI